MDRLAARIWRTIRRLDLMPEGARVVAAVSGGADSIALLHLLRDLESEDKCRVVAVGHLNHLLRGARSDEDEQFCRAAAESLGIPFRCERVDVGRVAAERRVSIESAAHVERYGFLERVAADMAADRIALGHTRDDQAETFLLRLLRGAGPRGLGGMHPRAGPFIRPMLECSREEVRQFVESRNIPFREDESNRDVSIPRNRVRHELMPVLSRISPGVVPVLVRESAIARDDSDLLETLAQQAFARIATPGDGRIEMDVVAIDKERPAIARRVLLKALTHLSGGRCVGFDHAETLLDLARRPSGEEVLNHLPGIVGKRVGSRLVLELQGLSAAPANSFRLSLSIPGEACAAAGWLVTAERRTLDARLDHALSNGAVDPLWAVLDARSTPSSLLVRNWFPGDRFRPLGVGGSKKLQDFFVDRKVPRALRASIPIVVTPEEQVVWVAGHTIAEDFRVTGSTSDVVILKLKYWSNGQ